MKLNNKEFKDLDSIINLKYCHIKPHRISSHYIIPALDYFNFFKFYFKTHFLVNHPDFSLEIDYSIMDILIIPFRLKSRDFEYLIELGAEESYLKNYEKILNGYDINKMAFVQNYLFEKGIRFKVILIEFTVLYNKNLEEKIRSLDNFLKNHINL